jgi:hypothetical protein
MTEGGGGSVREAVLTNLAHTTESAAAHIRPVSGRQVAGTACLIKAGTLLNIWLYFRDARDCGARVEALCWIYGWTRRLTCSRCLMHALRRGSGDTMDLRAPHAVLLGCTI